MTSPLRVLSVCADDFGLNTESDEVMLRLADMGRLTMLSGIVTGSAFRSSASAWSRLKRTCACGLHFNLTEGHPLSPDLQAVWPTFPALPDLIVRAYSGRLPLAAVAAEWQAQIDAFEQVIGAPPAFVDGHQHIHGLPGIRDVVVATAQARAWPVRSTAHVAGHVSPVKRWVIEQLGGRALGDLLRTHKVPHNDTLLGVYALRGTDYRRLMQHWLASTPWVGGLLVCHPGSAWLGDPIGPARVQEAAYLGSLAFIDDLDAAGVRLGGSPWQTPSAD